MKVLETWRGICFVLIMLKGQLLELNWFRHSIFCEFSRGGEIGLCRGSRI